MVRTRYAGEGSDLCRTYTRYTSRGIVITRYIDASGVVHIKGVFEETDTRGYNLFNSTNVWCIIGFISCISM